MGNVLKSAEHVRWSKNLTKLDLMKESVTENPSPLQKEGCDGIKNLSICFGHAVFACYCMNDLLQNSLSMNKMTVKNK